MWALMGAPLPGDAVTRAPSLPAGDAALRIVATVPGTAGLFRVDQLVAALARKRLWLTDFKREWHDGGWSPSIGQILRTLERTGADGLSSKAHRSIDAAFVQALRNAGMEFHVWTVDDLRTARRFCDLGANSITTNRPGWLKTRLRIDAARADNPDGIGQHRLPEG